MLSHRQDEQVSSLFTNCGETRLKLTKISTHIETVECATEALWRAAGLHSPGSSPHSKPCLSVSCVGLERILKTNDNPLLVDSGGDTVAVSRLCAHSVPTRFLTKSPGKTQWPQRKAETWMCNRVCAVVLIRMKKKQSECRRHMDRNVKEET